MGRQIAEELDRRRAAGDAALSACSSFASLPHTEGCCTGYAEGGIALYDRVMLGHLAHPSVAQALLLEHGCGEAWEGRMGEGERRRYCSSLEPSTELSTAAVYYK